MAGSGPARHRAERAGRRGGTPDPPGARRALRRAVGTGSRQRRLVRRPRVLQARHRARRDQCPRLRRQGPARHRGSAPRHHARALRPGPRRHRRRLTVMAIDFTLTPELEQLRLRVRDFIQQVVRPGEAKIGKPDQIERSQYLHILFEMRNQARAAGLWLPHMPAEWGGMGLGHVELAMVQAEAAKSYYGPWVLNCQAPDEGNMHTLLHWATDEQKE